MSVYFLITIYDLLIIIYKIGDSGSLSPWTYHENPAMTFFLVLFTFFTVIYLMNLFIGLLNKAIDVYDKYEEFLLKKAKVNFSDILNYSMIFSVNF